MHVTLKSHHAVGKRSLLRHKPIVIAIMKKAQKRFRIKVYNFAIAGNHIHLLIRGSRREDIQNFFRVFAGHTAQRILEECPLCSSELTFKPAKRGGAPLGNGRRRVGCEKNRRKFWSYLIYSRSVAWGREFRVVFKYVTKNTLEALGLIAYTPRLREFAARLFQVNSS